VIAVQMVDGDARTQIVSAATKLFARHGRDATSVQQIADAVGVTKQAVLHHFQTKDAVHAAVLEGILEHWKETLPRLLLAATASADRFDAVLGELHRFFAADPDRARVVLREALDRPSDVRKLLAGPVSPWLEGVAGYIRSGQDGGVHHEHVDAEAYVLEVMLLTLSTVAGAAVLAPVLGEGGAMRLDRELFRIAREALFVPKRARPATTHAPIEAQPKAKTKTKTKPKTKPEKRKKTKR
jgi:AcrR family transcriptional regulator